MRKIRRKICALLLVAVFMVVAVLPMSSVSAANTSTTKVTTTTIWKYQVKAYNESAKLWAAIKKGGWRVENYSCDYASTSRKLKIQANFVRIKNKRHEEFAITQLCYFDKVSKFQIEYGSKKTTYTEANAVKAIQKGRFDITWCNSYSTIYVTTMPVVKKYLNRAYNGVKNVSAALTKDGWEIIGYSGKYYANDYRYRLTVRKKVNGKYRYYTFTQDTRLNNPAFFCFTSQGRIMTMTSAGFVNAINKSFITMLNKKPSYSL